MPSSEQTNAFASIAFKALNYRLFILSLQQADMLKWFNF